MTARTNWLWVSTVIMLVVIAATGATLALLRNDGGTPVEIMLDERQPLRGTIYVGEGVAVPGIFPFSHDDTIGELIKAAGGPIQGADLSHLSLTVSSNSDSLQRVDINRAEAWLLQALPGIGEVLAQRIVDYRRQKGPFTNTVDLTRVSGLGEDTYEKIKDLITVSDY